MTFVCGVCYRPPNYNSIVNNALLEHLQFCLDEINKIPGTFVLLFGDFNADFVMGETLPNNDFGSYLYKWLECNGLFQVINEPTRITARSATLLDLIITNSPGYFVNSGAISPPSNCDHSLVYARMSISLGKQKCYTRHIWDYSKIDENLFIYCASLPSYNNCIKEAGTPQQLNTNYSGPFTKYKYKYRKQK